MAYETASKEFLLSVISARERTITKLSALKPGVVLQTVSRAQAMHDSIRGFLASVEDGTGPGGFDPMIARRDLLECQQMQAMSDAADGWGG